MVLNWNHSRLDLYWIQSGVNLTLEFLQCMYYKRRSLSSGVATGESKGAECPDSEKFAKNQGKKREKIKKREKNQEKEEKSGKFFYFAPPDR